jgi:hypothetical protein
VSRRLLGSQERWIFQECLFECLHQFGDIGFGFVAEGRSDGQVIGAVAAEVLDGVAFFDEDVEAAANQGAILGEDATELLQGAGAGVSQSYEGFFLALGEIRQGQDGGLMEEGAQVDPALPVVGVGKGGMERGGWIEAIF